MGAFNIDTLVLGCTHYPLLKPLLQEILGDRIRLVDSAHAIAEETGELLSEKDLRNGQQKPPEYRYYVTDVPISRELGNAFSDEHSPMLTWSSGKAHA